MDLNHRPPGYELLWAVQSVDFRRFLPIFIPGTFQIQDVIPSPLRREFSCSGSEFGSRQRPDLRNCAGYKQRNVLCAYSSLVRWHNPELHGGVAQHDLHHNVHQVGRGGDQHL